MKLVIARAESFDWIVIFDIIQVKLLNDDQNEKVQHNLRNNHDKRYEVNCCERGATCLTFQAIRPRIDGIVHNSVPVFASRYAEQQDKGLHEVPEILVTVVKYVSFSNLLEEVDAQHGEHEQN